MTYLHVKKEFGRKPSPLNKSPKFLPLPNRNQRRQMKTKSQIEAEARELRKAISELSAMCERRYRKPMKWAT